MTKSLFSNATYTSRWIVFLIDLSISMQAFFLAYLIRFNFSLEFGAHDFLKQLPLVGLASIMGFLMVGSFKGIVRHTGTKDAINVFWASTAVAAFLFTVALITRGYEIGLTYSIPLSIISVHYLLNIYLTELPLIIRSRKTY